MALHTLTSDGYLSWHCPGSEEEECGLLLTASLDEVIYQERQSAAGTTKPGRGAVIALPACSCGTQVFLKADYTLKELYKTLICYEQDGMRAFALPLRYVHNLKIHWMLYEHGKAAFAPVLEMPPRALLEHSSFAGVKPSTVYALWFGFATMKQHFPQALEAQTIFLIGE